MVESLRAGNHYALAFGIGEYLDVFRLLTKSGVVCYLGVRTLMLNSESAEIPGHCTRVVAVLEGSHMQGQSTGKVLGKVVSSRESLN